LTTDPRFDGPGPDARWSEALKKGEFLIAQCGDCGAFRFPPALACAACGSADVSLVPASGRGTVYSATTVRSREGDYNVSLVELAEGPRMMSRVEGVAPDAVKIGQEVAARIVEGEEPLVVFDPVEGA